MVDLAVRRQISEAFIKRSVRKQMEQQFGEGFGQQSGPKGFGGFGSPFAEQPRKEREGEVKVHKTPGTPEKRVSKDVGDYVDFEEEKQ